MKKPAKLLLRKETLRTLSDVQLTRLVAGTAPDPDLAAPPSDLKHCVAAAIVGGG
jgi:hypothetical protein